eukprot:TRINITY_DN5471_c0_g1_i2.p1 TRINITY_DN5471_c0_g1~~TRINITY_DN5471_c0_g1_i2.p1  ORF type:complete len:489 (+),score=117.93 TRINITY_DN5471_c0_g1_i2:175-1641(+)
MSQEPAQPQVHNEPAQDEIEAMQMQQLQPLAQPLPPSSQQQDLQQQQQQQQQQLQQQEIQQYEHQHQQHHHAQLQHSSHHDATGMQPDMQHTTLASSMAGNMVAQVNAPQPIMTMNQMATQMMAGEGQPLAGQTITMNNHMVSTPTSMNGMMPMMSMPNDQAYLSAHHVEPGEEMMAHAVTRFENLFPACVPAVLENHVPEDLINRARGWNKQDLRTVLSSVPIRNRLDSMYIPKQLFDQAVKMRHDYSNGAPRQRFAVEVVAEENDASNRRKTRFRCIACNRQHGFHSALQHVGASLRCPKLRDQLDWAQWNPCPWACFGMAFISQCLRPMSQNAKRKADDYEIQMKSHPGPASMRPSTADQAMMSSPAGMLRPVMPPASRAPGTPAVPYNHALATSAPRMTGPAMPPSVHGIPPPGGQEAEMQPESMVLHLEKLKDDMEAWQSSMMEQFTHYVGVINDMQAQVMQQKGQGQAAPQAVMASNDRNEG